MKKRKLISVVLAVFMVLCSVSAAVLAQEPEQSVKVTDCGHFTGADWAGAAGAYSLGWKYFNFDLSTITSIKVGAKDAKDRIVMEYTADAEQVAWQQANGYVTADGLSSAPFYKEYNGTPIAEGRDDDWTVTKGAGFDVWQPTLFYVEVKTADATYYDEMAYNYDYPGVNITDCGHFTGADWAGAAGAYSLGWKYFNFDLSTITSIKVGAKDAKDRIVMEYTADAEQVAWQQANGYVTADGLSSAPFYKEYNGTPIAEGRDDDWTVTKGAGFDVWQPTLFYVEVKTAGATYYDEMAYNYDYPHAHELVHHDAKAPTCTEKGWDAYDTCSECDYTTYAEKDALGHDFGEWETVTSPNCTDKGSEKHTCKRCEFFETRDLDELGHDWETDFTVDKAATCTEDGSKSIHCKNCDAAKDSTVIPATGHVETELKDAKEATCTEEGYTGDKVCKECGVIVEKGETIPQTAHNYKDGVCSECGAKDPDYKPDNGDNSPETGDNTTLQLWITLVFVSMSTVTILVVVKTKKRYS